MFQNNTPENTPDNTLDYTGPERRAATLETLDSAIKDSCKILNAMMQKIMKEGLDTRFSYRKDDNIEYMKELEYEVIGHAAHFV
jgi:hypothetical protein